MKLFFLFAGWVLPPPVPFGNFNELKDKWVLTDAVQYTDTSILDILDRRLNQGKDNRTQPVEIDKYNILEENYQKKILLDFLNNPNISILIRAQYADEYIQETVGKTNPMLRGGLLEDWDFTI